MFYNINVPVIISKFKSHNLVKDRILNIIKNDAGTAIHTERDNITKTDWGVHKDIPKKYLDILFDPLSEHLKESYKTLDVTGFYIHNFWYQQYLENSYHDWHNHDSCHYANVYFLEMEDASLGTEIKDPIDPNKIIKYNVQEGDILSFPSFLVHRSPNNIFKSRKTVISFNVSFLNYKSIH
jgi:hypothetical protein